MNILILGASGFIGSWVTTELIKEGHNVTCCVRNVTYTKRLFPQAKIISCEFIKDTKASQWKSRLKNIDIVVNCVGIFYHPNKSIIWKIHYYAPRALFDACFEMDVKKIIHISALNVEKYSVAYAKSKKAAEDFLLATDVPSVILKPSLVYGPGSYGGMSLFRGLASLPFLIPVPGSGNKKVQPIHVDDLAKSIVRLIEIDDKKSHVLAAVSMNPITITRLLLTLRTWLGFSKAKIYRIPIFFFKIVNLIGDRIPNSTVNSDGLAMLLKSNITNVEEAMRFQKVIKFVPREFTTGVYTHPSETQDRWHANLVIYRPLLRLSLAFMWLMSAVTSAFLFPKELSLRLLAEVGVSNDWQSIILYSSCLLNFLIAILLLINFKPKLNYILQICVIIFYSVIITIKLPYLWLEPFGPIVKNIPILIMILMLLSLERTR